MKTAGIFLFIFLVVSHAFGIRDQDIPLAPNPERLVNNFSKQFPRFFTAEETRALEDKLQQFARETSNQVVVVIVDTLNGLTPNEFATALGDKWKVGNDQFDNGLVILIKPSGGEGQREIYIAAGRGLEGVIPDVTARRIVEDEMIPLFIEGRIYEGVNAGLDILFSLAKGEYSKETYSKSRKKQIPFQLIIVLLLMILVFSFRRRRRRGFTIGRSGHYGGAGWIGGEETGAEAAVGEVLADSAEEVLEVVGQEVNGNQKLGRKYSKIAVSGFPLPKIPGYPISMFINR